MVGDRLLLLHKTPVEDGVPLALCAFRGRLLVGAGRRLRLYDLGKRRLLKKSESIVAPHMIVRLQAMGDRVFVSDLIDGVVFAKFRPQQNAFSVYADDYMPRFVTASVLLDYDTVAGADKFGNVWVLRLPREVSDDVDNPRDTRALWDQGLLNGAPAKADVLTHYYLGEAATCLTRTALVPGGREVLLAVTVTGGVHVLVPFAAREEREFYQQLEMYMRQELPNLARRDHLSFRSYFLPVKHTVDGELCEQFLALPANKQAEISGDLQLTTDELLKKLEDTRSAIL